MKAFFLKLQARTQEIFLPLTPISVNHPSTSVSYSAIKQLLLSQLQAALGLYVPDGSVLTQRDWDISLHRAKDYRRILYISGLALQLEKTQKIPALEIATALAKLVVNIATPIPGAGSDHDFTVQVVPPGWIHLELTEKAIAAWLQRLHSSPPRLSNLSLEHRLPRGDTSHLFAVQYAHARCCSLVYLAHREKLMIVRVEPNTSSAVFRAIDPDPIPWLNGDQIRFCLPAERALITQLLGLLDDLYCPGKEGKKIDWEKAALNLSQTFQNFYSSSRIWGEVKIQTLHLAQARLGLVMATQPILRLLLQDRLGVFAPLEL